tara:strand:+ start:16419 stop:17354 length:936 start_codon:yes stop_codon:yes gene_type:complete
MPVESNTLFGDDGIGDALNWVGNQFFIDGWTANPNDTTLENFDITKVLMDFGSKWEELQNCDTLDEAKNKMTQDIVSSILEHFEIDDAEKLESFLVMIDSEGNIEESLRNLSQFVSFEMVEGHEVETTHVEALAENALSTAEKNTEAEEEPEEEEPEEEEPEEEEPEEEEPEEEEPEEEEPEEEEPEEEEHVHGPHCEHESETFAIDEGLKAQLKERREQMIASYQEEQIEKEPTQGVPWGFIAEFWNEDLDLLKIVKEEMVAQILLERLESLHEQEMLTTKRQFVDALFLLLSGYPPAVASIIELFERLE